MRQSAYHDGPQRCTEVNLEGSKFFFGSCVDDQIGRPLAGIVVPWNDGEL